MAFLDRTNIGFAALHMNDALGITQTIFGLGAGVFFLGYFIAEVPSNILLHRFGARSDCPNHDYLGHYCSTHGFYS